MSLTSGIGAISPRRQMIQRRMIQRQRREQGRGERGSPSMDGSEGKRPLVGFVSRLAKDERTELRERQLQTRLPHAIRSFGDTTIGGI